MSHKARMSAFDKGRVGGLKGALSFSGGPALSVMSDLARAVTATAGLAPPPVRSKLARFISLGRLRHKEVGDAHARRLRAARDSPPTPSGAHRMTGTGPKTLAKKRKK